MRVAGTIQFKKRAEDKFEVLGHAKWRGHHSATPVAHASDCQMLFRLPVAYTSLGSFCQRRLRFESSQAIHPPHSRGNTNEDMVERYAEYRSPPHVRRILSKFF